MQRIDGMGCRVDDKIEDKYSYRWIEEGFELRTQEETNENGRRARAIYHEKIKPQLTDEDHGRYIAIDTESGEWAISDGEDAIKLLKQKTDAKYPFLLVHPRMWVNRMGWAGKG